MTSGNEFVKRLYDFAPYGLKKLFASSYGILQRKQRYGKKYFEQIKLLSESQYWSSEELSSYQQKRLDFFFAEVFPNIPFYKNNTSYSKLAQKYSDTRDFPILSKQLVKTRIKDFYNPNLKNVIWQHTSGTTGSAMIFPVSLEAYQIEYAFRYMHYNWGGVNLHNRDKVTMCSGHPVAWSERTRPPFWIYDRVNNHLFFSSYHLSELNLRYYIKKLEDFDPLLLHGYPSSIYILALAFEKFRSKNLNLKSIYTSSETLLDFQRKKIEEAFQVKVFNWYGTSEMSVNIVECEKGELHLKAEHSFIEILNSNNLPCKPGESGRIISTNFNNTAFPLVRYDVGDTVTISKSQISKCGRSGLLIDHIEGRIEDYVLTPDGRIVGRLDHLFKDAINVKEAQIEQPNKEEVILRVVRGIYYSKNDEIQILKEAKTRLGISIRISFDYVEQIPRTSNGKFRFIISKINQSFLQK